VAPVWDHESLRAWFTARPGEDVVETDLLRAFFPEPLGEGLELFQKHFLLYRRLWLFDDELRVTTGERLWIRGIRSTLLPPAPPGRCTWLNSETGRYCLRAALGLLCPHHDTTVPEANGMKSYYLDERNLEGMTEEGVAQLLDGFYRWMGPPGAAQALVLFGLPPEASTQEIKARWRELSKKNHPDRGGDSAEYQRLSAAWAALKHRT